MKVRAVVLMKMIHSFSCSMFVEERRNGLRLRRECDKENAANGWESVSWFFIKLHSRNKILIMRIIRVISG